jgi:SAM-dependent methyltransferase
MIDNTFNKQQYSQNSHQYLETNVDGKIGGGTPVYRVSLLLKFLPKGRKVFEIGSGGGLDALELQNAGYKVTASDFVDRFIEELKNKGIESIYFDAKTDEFPETDAIYINAVFVHFTPEEIRDCLKRMKEKLRNEKTIFISVLKGNGYERSARGRGFERDFHYYSLDSLETLLREENYEILFSDELDNKWIQLVAKFKD